MIFDKESIKELFLSVVKRAKAKYSFQIENFCVMGNHFHFIIQPMQGNSLSEIMRWILSVFAMAFNRANGLTGHVWGSRFFSRIISGLRYLIKLFKYIDDNAVRACQTSDRKEWRYGGLWHNRSGCRDIVVEPQDWISLLLPDHGVLLLSSDDDPA
jgi:REP element-mobilizing transposase RayT